MKFIYEKRKKINLTEAGCRINEVYFFLIRKIVDTMMEGLGKMGEGWREIQAYKKKGRKFTHFF